MHQLHEVFIQFVYNVFHILVYIIITMSGFIVSDRLINILMSDFKRLAKMEIQQELTISRQLHLRNAQCGEQA